MHAHKLPENASHSSQRGAPDRPAVPEETEKEAFLATLLSVIGPLEIENNGNRADMNQ